MLNIQFNKKLKKKIILINFVFYNSIYFFVKKIIIHVL